MYFLTYEHEEEHRGQFLSTVPAVPYNVELLRRKGIYYVVVNYNTFNELKDEFIRALEREAKMIKAFSPYYDGKIGRRYDRIDTTCLSVGSKELFSRRLMGPCLVIYKIKTNRQ